MLDFSIGHRLILLRQRNPLIWMAEKDFNELPFMEQVRWLRAAVNVCSLPMFPNWRTRMAWRWRNYLAEIKRSWAPTDWALETAKFRIYLDSARIVTEFNARREGFPFLPTLPMPDASGRSLGGPYDAALLQFLISSGLCRTQNEALEYPLAMAQIHFMTWLEREGNLRIMNAFEMDFEEYAHETDLAAAKAAGFSNVADFKADLLLKAQSARRTGQKSEKEESHG